MSTANNTTRENLSRLCAAPGKSVNGVFDALLRGSLSLPQENDRAGAFSLALTSTVV